jgi:superfamily II DNA or RNA helicase
MHQRIGQALHEAGIDLTPLMLVQVGNHDQAVKEARALLVGLGVPEERIASYTAKEPTNDLLAVALDEQYEVLIFKMSVALGFDAPRAFVLASLRGAKDTDFGIQVVGRMLRVHRRLQPGTLEHTLPPGLHLRLCVSGRCGESDRTGQRRRADQRRCAMSWRRSVETVHGGLSCRRSDSDSGDGERSGKSVVDRSRRGR